MKTVVWSAYGGPEVLQVRQVPRPEPGPGELLVRVRATTVSAGDVELRASAFRSALTVPLRLMFGIVRPRGNRVLGQELAGDVVSVESDVDRFSVGDKVCAHMGLRFGGYSEFATVPQGSMVERIPEGVSYEEAATVPTAGMYAFYFVRQARIDDGASVLVNGAGGSIGTYTIQMAKAAGAVVTGVDRREKEGLIRSLGADHFMDYSAEDFTVRQDEYDRIMDVVDKTSFPRAAPALKPGGTYLHTSTSLTEAITRRLFTGGEGRQAVFVRDPQDRDAMAAVLAKLASGELRSVIDRRFSLDELAEAHRYAETGVKQGHIVIEVDG